MKAEWRIWYVINDVVVVRGGVADCPKLREHCAEREVVGAFGDTFCHSKVAEDDGTIAFEC